MTADQDFSDIYDTFHPRILRYLTRMVGPDEAEDLSQEVFDKIHRGLTRFQGRARLSTWIYRIATNTAIDKFRSPATKYDQLHTSLEDEDHPASAEVSAAQDVAAADQLVIRKEMRGCINEFIDKLPTDYKTVLILAELEGFANKEIASILEISLANVKIRLHRARVRLKQSLQTGCDFYYTDGQTLACDRKQVQISSKPPK